MLSAKMEKALNDQIREEMYSAYLYLSMAAWFKSQNLDGFSKWMIMQFKEEQMHAQKFFGYIHDRRGTVKLQALEAPPTEWKSALEAYEASFKHEQHITGRIKLLYDIAVEEKDRATQVFLDWFVSEQVEEENSVDEFVQLLKMVGEKPQGLFMVNHQAGQRGAE
jgi:ferritin